MPELSILVPCYNVEKWLESCLKSIQRQTFEDFEVICLNDGSTDSTLEILENFARLDPRFKVLSKPNTGYGDSMNRGIDMAVGIYIGIVEPDDWIEPSMFERLLEVARKNDADVVRGGFLTHKDGTVKKSKPFSPLNVSFKPLETQSVFYLPPAVWSSIYKRSWLNEKRIRFLPTPGAAFQDVSFTFKTEIFARNFVVVDAYGYNYRIHGGNSVSLKETEDDAVLKTFAVMKEWQEIFRIVKAENLLERTGNILYSLQYRTYKWNCLRLPVSAMKRFLDQWAGEWQQLGAVLPRSVIHHPLIKLYALLIVKAPNVFLNYLLFKHC